MTNEIRVEQRQTERVQELKHSASDGYNKA